MCVCVCVCVFVGVCVPVQLPCQQVYELRLGHAVREDTGDSRHTRPEQINLGLPLTPVNGEKKNNMTSQDE